MEFKYTGEVQKMSLDENDIVVFKLEKHMPTSAIDFILAQAKKHFPNNKVLVLNKDMTMQIVKLDGSHEKADTKES